MKHKLISLIFFLVSSSLMLFGQVAVEDFVRSAWDDPEVRSFDGQIDYLKEQPYRLSPLQRLEFRTQNRELLRTQQEYALRFTPSNPWEVRNNNLYFKEYQSSLAYRKEIAVKQALVDRYLHVIYVMHYKEMISLVNEDNKLTEDQIQILKQQSGSSFFDADKLVDLHFDQLDKTSTFEELDFGLANQIVSTVKLYPKLLNQNLTWTYHDVVSIANIKRIIDSLSSSSVTSTFIAYQQQKIKLAQREYKLEKSNVNLGFLQTEFDHRRVEQNRTPYNISLGIVIPIVNPNKGDMTKRYLESIEAQYKLEEAKSEEQIDKIILTRKLDKLIARYFNLEKKIIALNEGDLSQTLQSLKGNDPLVNLQFRERVIKMNVLLSKIKRDVYVSYIEYLALTDRLHQQPIVNYLSKGL